MQLPHLAVLIRRAVALVLRLLPLASSSVSDMICGPVIISHHIVTSAGTLLLESKYRSIGGRITAINVIFVDIRYDSPEVLDFMFFFMGI
jgi:hypothetical protein